MRIEFRTSPTPTIGVELELGIVDVVAHARMKHSGGLRKVRVEQLAGLVAHAHDREDRRCDPYGRDRRERE